MVAESFASALRAFTNRKPFKAFAVDLVNGERIVVEHPEALVFRNSITVYFSPQKEIAIFDHEGVARLTDQTERVTS